MWKQKLALGTSESLGIEMSEQIQLIKEVGFEGIFFNWYKDAPINNWINEAKDVGLVVQSIHAPFKNAKLFWYGNENEARMAIDEQKECIDICSKHDVGIMIVHAFIGFKDHTPTDIGLKRFSEVVNYATEKNVKIAFENTEGEEYLAALMNKFENNNTVGFCWDSGHEMCYNHSKDMLALYGNKLIATHINDNLGIRDFNGEIIYLDDLHLLPYDGIADWDYNISRLKKHGCPEYLTFELTTQSKRGRYDNDKYAKMKPEEYIAECYNRACRLGAKISL